MGSLANEKLSAFNGAIDLCLELPSNKATIAETLKELGWQSKFDGDARRVAFEVLYSNIFTSNHRPDDLEHTYRNASLIAISTLRNSTVNSFTTDDLKLSILSNRDKNSYCLFTGSRSHGKAIQEKFNVQLKEVTAYLKARNFAVDSVLVRVQQIDMKRFGEIHTKITAESLKKNRTNQKSALQETNLYLGRNPWGAKK